MNVQSSYKKSGDADYIPLVVIELTFVHERAMTHGEEN